MFVISIQISPKIFSVDENFTQCLDSCWKNHRPRSGRPENADPPLMASQPTPLTVPPLEIRPGPYQTLIKHWFPLIRPAIKPLFLRGVG